ncbi:MAG: hypothetical protein JWN40_5294 [Phycisphaerales bacterium]|nr:hypothetical protein [Phycisphaerales bacterium]
MSQKPHPLDYASTKRSDTSKTMGAAYRLVAVLNTFSLVCAGLFFLLMLLTSNDRWSGLLAIYLAGPAVLVHCAIAGLPAWVYLAGSERTETNRRALFKLFIRSLLPFGVIGLAVLVTFIVPKTK